MFTLIDQHTNAMNMLTAISIVKEYICSFAFDYESLQVIVWKNK